MRLDDLEADASSAPRKPNVFLGLASSSFGCGTSAATPLGPPLRQLQGVGLEIRGGVSERMGHPAVSLVARQRVVTMLGRGTRTDGPMAVGQLEIGGDLRAERASVLAPTIARSSDTVTAGCVARTENS